MITCLFDQVSATRGVEIRLETKAMGPFFKGDRVAGIHVKKNGTGQEERIGAQWVVDSSGIQADIASQVPYTYPFGPDPLRDQDIFVGAKEIIPVNGPHALQAFENLVALGFGGGMAWTMTYGEALLDVGVAIPKSRDPRRLKSLLNTLKARLKVPLTAPVYKGAGMLPARRCRTRLVGDGFLAAGDAGCQVNPSNGGGIPSSLLSGHIAGTALAKASTRGKEDASALWDYPKKYVKVQGAHYAGLDVLRLAFQNLPEKDMIFCLKHHIIRDKDLAMPFVTSCQAPLEILDALSRGFTGLARPDLLYRLSLAALRAQKATRLYSQIPADFDPESIARWEKKIYGFFQQLSI